MATYRKDRRNANRPTERGWKALAHSLETYGAGRSILVDRNGQVIAGNKTLEEAERLGLPVIDVPSDGSALVVVRRTDLDLDTDTAARELAYADNIVSALGFDLDPATVAEDLAMIDLDGLGYGAELDALIASVTVPDFAPVGIDEQGRLDEKAKCTCPECGHVFTP